MTTANPLFNVLWISGSIGAVALSCRCIRRPSAITGQHSPRQVSGAIATIAATAALASLVTWLAAAAIGAPFDPLLRHTGLILLLALGYVLALGCLWDATLVGGALALRRDARGCWQRRGFFSLGAWPLLLLLPAVYSVIATSNIALMSLHLLHQAPNWRDPTLWSIESPLLTRLTAWTTNVQAWDILYQGCWLLELLGVFLLIVTTRHLRSVTQLCLSFILLFYVGRLAGLVNPVMGPAFYKPELYGFLDGTVSQTMMQSVFEVMSTPPGEVQPSAALLGGISAMPSLHVAMVALTAYWLAAARRWTLYGTVPWVLGVWVATVVLGWHYALDGLCGFALAAFCIYVARRVGAPILDRMTDDRAAPVHALAPRGDQAA